MKSIPTLISTLAMATFAVNGFAADPADHEAHHPDATPSKAAPKKAPAPSAKQTDKMDSQMKAMREMHEKMMNAKTPEERQALMADHMKMMKDGMSMMNGMMGGGMMGGSSTKTPSPEMMQKEIDMMKTMMQMMMDRMEMSPPAK
jgi:hypothetical protein